MKIHVGLCGMQMARGAYFKRFRLTEVQQTFYQPPRVQTLRKWREEAPPGFEFTLKAWQIITHTPNPRTYRRLRKPVPPGTEHRYGRFQLTDEVMNAWNVTLECARALESRVIIFQCPASFTLTDQNVANLRAFFDAVRPQTPGLVLGWEPRGNWPRDLIRSLVDSLGLLYVVDPFRNEPFDGPMRYFRLHGRTDYHDKYSDDELRRLLGWCRGETYVMFNNVPMVDDAGRFIALIRDGGLPA